MTNGEKKNRHSVSLETINNSTDITQRISNMIHAKRGKLPLPCCWCTLERRKNNTFPIIKRLYSTGFFLTCNTMTKLQEDDRYGSGVFTNLSASHLSTEYHCLVSLTLY